MQRITYISFLIITLFAFCSRKVNVTEKKQSIFSDTSKNIAIDISKDKEKISYYKKDFLRYDDYIYADNIKTVRISRSDSALSYPVIMLNSDEYVNFSFDDLDGDIKNYKYTLIHCDPDWNPSDLIQSEYLESFTDDNISKYTLSVNTIQKYTHYEFVLPNYNIKPIKSGSYIVKIFIDNSENVMITRKLLVYENLVNIDANVKQATIIEDKKTKQEIDFTINAGDYQISNPYADLKVLLTQNGRKDNIIKNLKPFMVKGNQLIYDYDYGNSFTAGNEFRNFDIKSLKYYSSRIAYIKFDSMFYHVYLKNDERRPFKRYYFDFDINGKEFIKTEDARNSKFESEYTWVHFTLPYQAPLTDGAIYILGALTDWNIDKKAQMIYNYRNQSYEAKLYLKQGYYNYQYVFLQNDSISADECFIEGCHFETENDYSIFVYHKPAGQFYYKLIGVKNINSLKK